MIEINWQKIEEDREHKLFLNLPEWRYEEDTGFKESIPCLLWRSDGNLPFVGKWVQWSHGGGKYDGWFDDAECAGPYKTVTHYVQLDKFQKPE